MAKLKAPLMSLGASGALGKALVFFPWKGLDVVREYVVPANPRTAGQTTQRGYLADAVDFIHANQAEASHPIDAEDISALALLGSTHPTPRTWFNELVKILVESKIRGYGLGVLRDGHCTPGADQLTVAMTADFTNTISAGSFWYGTSKTALIHSIAATIAAGSPSKAITGLVTGVKYFVQFRPTAPASTVGLNSGIYYGVPT